MLRIREDGTHRGNGSEELLRASNTFVSIEMLAKLTNS
jgi:hypothetical protein